MTARRSPHGWKALAGVVATIGGAWLLVWTVRTAGAGLVFDAVRRLGAGFIVVLMLSGARYVLRAVAWRCAVEPPDRLQMGTALACFLAGDALGNVTPLGLVLSEPSKILLLGRRIQPKASISALTVENLLYSGSVVVMLAAGTAALLLSFDVQEPLRAASFATLVCAIAVAVAAGWIVTTRRHLVSRLLDCLIAWNIGRHYLLSRREHVTDIEDRIYGFARRRPGRVLQIAALEIAYQAAAVAEIWVALTLMTGTPPRLLTAFVLEYVNRTITIAFQFVPMWLGVDEAGTGLVAGALSLGSATGVSLALVRKARLTVWTILGIVLLIRQGVSLKAAIEQTKLAATDR